MVQTHTSSTQSGTNRTPTIGSNQTIPPTNIVHTVYSTTHLPITTHSIGTPNTSHDSLAREMNGLYLHKPKLKKMLF